MILETGDTLFVSHRRMFERDEARYFLGKTISCDGPIVKVIGYSFVRDLANGGILKKEERRIKILSLDSPGYIVYQLPGDIDVDAADIKCDDGEAVLHEGGRGLMNLAERTHCGHF
ncbi:MAG: hypothetical protein KDB27_18145 [Planctomycetales bacterium]|nr:hypothetical protein [Planctomycetales bacterium]